MLCFRFLGSFLGVMAHIVAAGNVQAAPDGPVVVQVPTVGQSFSPGFRQLADVASSYVEEEFLIKGQADLFSYTDNPPVPGAKARVAADVPYGTRFIVRRPVRASDFNGTVVIEWLNSSANLDTAPVWDASAEYFVRSGIVYVGFTNANQALVYLLAGCPQPGTGLLQCEGRYQPPVVFPFADDGLAFEAASQLANLIRGRTPDNPLPPRFRVRRVFHAGNSQQGGSVTTYSNEFHQPGLNDGYFIQVAGGTSRRLSAKSPTYAPGDPNGFAPDDLPVPVVRAQAENDVARRALQTGDATFTRQANTPTFRYYELAGVAHNPVHKDIELVGAGDLFPGSPAVRLEDLCTLESNTSADGPVFGAYLYNAMWRNLERQTRFGIPMPVATPLPVTEGQIARDRFGNARGGLRLAALDVPTATYLPLNQPNTTLPLPPDIAPLQRLVCLLNGGVERFDAATLARLYPRRSDYVIPIAFGTLSLLAQGFLLPEDAQRLIQNALTSGVGGSAP